MVKAEWVSYIQLNMTREAKIQSCCNCELQFHYPKNLDLDNPLEFKLCLKNSSNDDTNYSNNSNNSNNSYGENIKTDLPIVLDDFSGLADCSKNFTSFLTVARKFR